VAVAGPLRGSATAGAKVRKAFFFEEKNQKTFTSLVAWAARERLKGKCEPDKSFLLLFLEKEGQPSLRRAINFCVRR
jgi:hypothetical protein